MHDLGSLLSSLKSWYISMCTQVWLRSATVKKGEQGISATYFHHSFIRQGQRKTLFNGSLVKHVLILWAPKAEPLSREAIDDYIRKAMFSPDCIGIFDWSQIFLLTESHSLFISCHSHMSQFPDSKLEVFFSPWYPRGVTVIIKNQKSIIFYCSRGNQLPTIINIVFPEVEFVKFLITPMKSKFISH